MVKTQKDEGDTIVQGLSKQFDNMWEMVAQAIDLVSDDGWTHNVGKWFYSLTVYHVIEAAEFYFRDTPEGMEWGKSLGQVNWWDHMSREDAAKQFPKVKARKYLTTMIARGRKIFNKLSTGDLKKQDGFKWFDSVAEKFTYLLRHNAHHIGELALNLRLSEENHLKWT